REDHWDDLRVKPVLPETASRWSRSWPPTHRRTAARCYHRRSELSRARPASHQSARLPGLRPRTPTADSWARDIGVSSLRLAPSAPVRPRLAGCPVRSVSQEAVEVEDLLGMEQVIEGPAELVGQHRQRFRLAQPRRQLLQVPADPLVLLGAEDGGLGEGPLQPGVALPGGAGAAALCGGLLAVAATR